MKSTFRVRGELEAIHFARADVVVDGAAKDEHGVADHRRRVEETPRRRLRILKEWDKLEFCVY